MLTNKRYKRIYRTQSDNLVRDFFEPALKESLFYDRATGYFSAYGLLELAPGLVPFAQNGGKIRLVTSVDLSEENEAIIKRGEELRDEQVESNLEQALMEQLDDPIELANLDLIVNLIACGRVEIRIAYMPNGLYHEKFGVFRDVADNAVYFCGSTNETKNGIVHNRESFTVLCSWRDGREDIDSEFSYFESLWQNDADGIRVMTLPEACKENLIRSYRASDSVADAISNVLSTTNANNNGKKRLYSYQKDAVNEFLKNDGCHFLQMATGTGKTFTAIKAIQAAEKNFGTLFVVIAVPQTDLQEQWRRALEEQGIICALCGGLSNKDAYASFDDSVIDYFDRGETTVIVSVYPTYFDKLNTEFSRLDGVEKLFIVDEAHSLSSRQISALPNSSHRLGLSATPERFSQQETEKILHYFTKGSVSPFEYGIDRAIEQGFLSRYYYYPLTVELDENSFKKFATLTKKIAVIMNQEPVDEKQLNDTRTARSLVLKKAPGKLAKLESLLVSSQYNFSNSVVYCGAGKDPETDDPIIEKVLDLIGGVGSYRVSSFTSKSENRVQTLKEFERGFFDTLVAIKCFDQGVDVPKLDKIYIMASDSSKRQTVQRRGRVLRTCAETGKTHAYIYDMVVLPPSDCSDESSAKSLMGIELARVREYGAIAENYDEVSYFVQNLEDMYGIEEMSFDEDAI